MFSAIVIVAPEIRTQRFDDDEDLTRRRCGPTADAAASQEQAGADLAMVEVLGRSVVARLAGELRRAGIEEILMFGKRYLIGGEPDGRNSADRQKSGPARNPNNGLTCRQNGTWKRPWSYALAHTWTGISRMLFYFTLSTGARSLALSITKSPLIFG